MSKQIFTCPHCKAAPKNGQWRRNYRWKTKRGFENHQCWKDIESAKIKTEQAHEEQKKLALEKAVAESKYNVGEQVHYYSYTVTKPTHEWRGTRHVKVRYEEVRSYWNSFGTIQKIEVGGYIIDGRFVQYCNITETKEEAYEKAKKQDAAYKEHCNFSSLCR